ncbi:MAG: LysM peptidoglycan-binding domain-containing protein [Lachnospiraceae bacterium]|nr:LysM peptidoglycan-binding domain-containing protein [Lachnospiraceae bacterium]
MEQQFPKNVRQIGNVSDNPKIYVEDYVDTFLNQLCDYNEENAVGAFLVGTQIMIEDQPCVYISGVVQMDELTLKDGEPLVDDTYVKKMREEKEKYFHDGELVGWFLALPGRKAETNENIIKIHEKTFPKTNTVFIIRDTAAKEEMFFAYKYHDLLEIGGHYIYYEKNPDMQNYMITKRRQTGMTPSETVEDQAAKNFRSIVREKMGENTRTKPRRWATAVTTLIIVVALVMGVTLLNNYDRMKTAQKSLELLAKGEMREDAIEAVGEGVIENPNFSEAEAVDVTAETSSEIEQKDMLEDGQDDIEEKNINDTGQMEPEGSILQEEAVEVSSGAVLCEDDFYVVQKGDTLDSISKKVYGDISHVDAICRMNGLQDGNLIFIGQKILLP